MVKFIGFLLKASEVQVLGPATQICREKKIAKEKEVYQFVLFMCQISLNLAVPSNPRKGIRIKMTSFSQIVSLLSKRCPSAQQLQSAFHRSEKQNQSE